jgi:two-component system nitrogen regulation sensor histidine kinase GlnL
VARRAQHSGGGRRRDGQVDDSQRAESLLRATKHDQLSSDPPDNKRGDPPAGDVFSALNTGVVLLDQNLLITEMNPAAENLLGISQNRAYRKPLLPLVDDDPEIQDMLARSLRTGQTYAAEIRLAPTEVHAEERIVDFRVSSLEHPDLTASLLIEMSDVTRRLRISRENALLIQHGAGRQMIRQLAHEIKNPLGGIRGAAQLLGKQFRDEELEEYTSVIISEADRLAGLVDTLLGPGGPPNKERANIHELLEYVIRLIQAEVGEDIEIRRDYDPGLPAIDLDRDQLVQALINLVRNAVAALGGQGRVILRSRAIMNFTIGDTRHKAVASLEIEDDGPGIPPDLQDSIFYPLVTSRPDGTGLGLPVAQELISRHHGLIEFESRPGRTVFFVRIPLAAEGQHE